MKTKIISLAVLVMLGACNDPVHTEYVEYSDETQYQTFATGPDVTPGVSTIKYSVPRDGDLTLETRHHIIQVQGKPGTQYEYRVWAGDKTTVDDPDLIIDGGDIMVLKQE